MAVKLSTLWDCVTEALTETKWALESGAQRERALGTGWKYKLEEAMLP